MKFWIVVLTAMIVCQSAKASCDDLMIKHKVEEPEFGQLVLWPPKGYFGCSREQTAMLNKNYNAINRAEPPDSIDEIIGTWLGDDVLPGLFGMVVYGQEVLKIKRGPQVGLIQIEQYWYDSIFDDDDRYSDSWWEEGEGYSGLIRRITLEAQTNSAGKLVSWDVLDEVDGLKTLTSSSPEFDALLKNSLDRFKTGLKISVTRDA